MSRAISFVFFVSLCFSCSDDNSTVSCGDGTRLRDGVCVIDDVHDGSADGIRDTTIDSSDDNGDSGSGDAVSDTAVEADVGADTMDRPDTANDQGSPDNPDADADGDDGSSTDPPVIFCEYPWDCGFSMLCRDSECVSPPATCSSNLDCPYETVCDAGACVRECGMAGVYDDSCDCDPTRICVSNRCVDPPVSCQEAADCPCVSLVDNGCNAGSCEATCTPGTCDCRAGYRCESAQCVPDDRSCSFDDDCACDLRLDYHNAHCVEGGCGLLCSDSCECSAGLTCQDGHCLPAPTTCAVDSDCPCVGGVAGHCFGGLCLEPCSTACDCGTQRICRDGYCQIAPGTCAAEADCPCRDSAPGVCDAGACHFGACQSSCECPGDLACSDGHCLPADPYNCAEDNDCPCGHSCVESWGNTSCDCNDTVDCPAGRVCDRMTGGCVDPPAVCASSLDCPLAVGTYQRCVAGSCVSCGSGTACYGSDASCGLCDDGTPTICHHDLSTPDDDGNAHCYPPCASNLDCEQAFGDGPCVDGRCHIAGFPASCVDAADCPGLMRSAGGEIFIPTCMGGTCQAPSCEHSCDCSSYFGAAVCVDGLCVDAPSSCSSVDDCPCSNSGQYFCNSPGVCGPRIW